MHYDAITHTQRAIRNLQSQVRLFLRKQQEEGLPLINKRQSLMMPKQIPLTVRSNRHRSQFESPSNVDSPQKKGINTISYDQMQQSNRVNVVILKPRVKRKSKVILPSFQKSYLRQPQNIEQKHSLQLMQIALVEQQSQPQSAEPPKSKKPPQKRQAYISKIPRYSKANASVHNYKRKSQLKVPDKEDDKISKTLDLQQHNIIKRVECYSPWQMKTDHQDLYHGQDIVEQFE